VPKIQGCHNLLHCALCCRYLGTSEVGLKQRPMYAHLTTATDTQLINRVFNSVAEIIMNDILKDIGLN